MMIIARNQILFFFMDARFIILIVLSLLLFALNGFIYSNLYEERHLDWQEQTVKNQQTIGESSGSLQQLAGAWQLVVSKPSPLMFIAEAGDMQLPNAAEVNAFRINTMQTVSRANKQLWTLPSLDWSFIVGFLLSLAALFFSFDLVNGEKRDGTLKYVLANSLSRFDLFLGKFLGLVIVLLLTLLIGILVNLLVIAFIGAIPADALTVVSLGWPFLLSALFIVWTGSLGMLVSSLFHRPAVSLVVLLVAWLVFALVIPGAARMLGTNLSPVRLKATAEAEQSRRTEEINERQDNLAFNYPNDPANQPEILAARKNWTDALNELHNTYLLERNREKTDQYQKILLYSSPSPISLLGNALAHISGTGLHGYENLLERSWHYKNTLMNFVEEVDASDSESPHMIYSFGSYGDRGSFSTKSVEPATVPRYTDLWPGAREFSREIEPPMPALLYLTGLLVATLAAAFAVFARFDPR
jgi:ABC-type transport system involved in multi-copper enzyme maturation permease subunit